MMIVGLPGGSTGSTAEDALTAFDSDDLWNAPAAEMVISFAGTERRQLTIVRRIACGACLHLRTREGEWLSCRDFAPEGEEELQLEDVSVFYPHRFFIDKGTARTAITQFCGGSTHPSVVQWRALASSDLRIVPFGG